MELKSYGVIVNSFHGLESTYSEHYRKVMGGKVWHFGPVSLSNRYAKDKTQKTNTAASKECLRQLYSKKPNSDLYVCFASV